MNCKQILEDGHIPYHQINGAFVLPGVIIKPCSRKALDHSNSLLKIGYSIARLQKLQPKKSKLLVLIDTTAEDLEVCDRKLDDVLDGEYFVIRDLCNIQSYCIYSYFIDSCGPLWTLSADPSIRQLLLGNRPIVVPDDVYKNAIAIMTDTELQDMPVITTGTLQTAGPFICHITTDRQRKNIFYEFALLVKNMPLPGGIRHPCRVVPGVTEVCVDCGAIFHKKYFTCVTHACERRTAAPPHIHK